MTLDGNEPLRGDLLEVARRTGRLDLSRRGLTKLPRELSELTGLEELRLDGNQLTELPSWIGQLVSLTRLRLDGNELAELPSEFGQLRRIRGLRLDGNRLTSLPSWIGEFNNLLGLRLEGNQLMELPPEFGQLTGLQELRLDSNQLIKLPPEFGQLTRIQGLRLDSNQLIKLPPEFGQLTRIQGLRLDSNQLIKLPPEFGQLTRIQRLRLGGNQLAGLPTWIGLLRNLRELRLNGNQLAELPSELSQLTRLQGLWLDDNRLTSLPPWIGQLTSLQELHLNGNQLTEIPRELAAQLGAGLTLGLARNPLMDPLPELILRGAAALATYLASLKDADPQYEAKIILVGEGNVGKTSLVAALRERGFIEGRPTTHGIEIHPLILRHPHLNLDMTIRTWDFGGQEVYRITHQFFFSRRALYLVVWNAREGQEQNEVEGWLRRIRLRVGDDARTLVVATHCDERHPELDYPQLQDAFARMLTGQHEIDNRTCSGIVQLREEIAQQAALLPQMGQLINRRWIAAREEILARAKTEPQISYEEFVRVCQRHGVADKEIITLAELLHDLGQIIYYGEDEGLKDIVVLKPEWLTKAISYVLEDKETRRADGVLNHLRLREIWQDKADGSGYPVKYHRYFLRLMEKFDVSYRLEDHENSSLVAQLVPHDRPNLPWDTGTAPPSAIRTLAMICQLSDPAPGLIAWLTVRQYRASTGMYWRSGVFLRHPNAAYASEALMEQRSPGELTVEVRAPSPDLFFNVLRDSVEHLISTRWPGLSYQLFIPCPTRAADGMACQGKFPLDGLLRWREKGLTKYQCLDCVTEHDVSGLLTGFTLSNVPLQPELERMHRQIATVASGVDRLERQAAETAQSVRSVLRVVSTEVTDCPRLFTLSRETRPLLRFYRRRRYRLVLWCEHPGQWHPWPSASYSVDHSWAWLVRIGPYMGLVFKTLRLVVPVAASVAGVMLSPEQLKAAQQELDLMQTVVKELPSQALGGESDFDDSDVAGQLTHAEGQALRAVRVWLFGHDYKRAFGGLRRVVSPSGDFLWVCSQHHYDYDPGLPNIP